MGSRSRSRSPRGRGRSRSRSRSPPPRGGGGGGGYQGGNHGRNEDAKLYVGNLSFNAVDSDIRGAFEKYGVVTDVFLPQDRDTGKSRGFGFVTFDRVSEAEDAIAGLDGEEFDGRRIRVNKPQPRGTAPPRGGGGGGGGYGGGYGGGGGGGGGYGRGRSPPRGGGYGRDSSPPRGFGTSSGFGDPKMQRFKDAPVYDRVTGDRIK